MPRGHAVRHLLAAAALVALVACAGPSARSSADRTLTLLFDADERVFGPAWDAEPKTMLFLPLVSRANCDDADHVGLAERWEHSADRRIWTVYLRRDIRWHDGMPVTAHDVVFTVKLWQHPDVQYYAGVSWGSVEAVDDYTLRITHEEPSNYVLSGWDVFYPKHLLEHLDPKTFIDWAFWSQPIGNGPYRYVRHVAKTMTVLEPNPDYYRDPPTLDRLIVKYGGSPLTELRSGNVDIVTQLDPLDAVKVGASEQFVTQHETQPARTMLFFNHRNAMFQDVRLRRALAMAIDRRALHRVLDLPDDLPITDGLYTSCQFDRRNLAPPWPYDPDEARRLLTEAGWQDPNQDGVRERGDRELTFTTIVGPGLWEQAAVFVQDQLRRVGARMEISTLDGGIARSRLRAGDFEAGIGVLNSPSRQHAWFFGDGDPMPGGRGPSVTEYRHARLAELLKQAAFEADDGARDELYMEIREIFRSEVPAVYLFPLTRATVMRRGVRIEKSWGYAGLGVARR